MCYFIFMSQSWVPGLGSKLASQDAILRGTLEKHSFHIANSSNMFFNKFTLLQGGARHFTTK